MCLGAIYWARPESVYYACTKEDAAEAGFDDSFIYKEIALPEAERTIPFPVSYTHLDVYKRQTIRSIVLQNLYRKKVRIIYFNQ